MQHRLKCIFNGYFVCCEYYLCFLSYCSAPIHNYMYSFLCMCILYEIYPTTKICFRIMFFFSIGCTATQREVCIKYKKEQAKVSFLKLITDYCKYRSNHIISNKSNKKKISNLFLVIP